MALTRLIRKRIPVAPPFAAIVISLSFAKKIYLQLNVLNKCFKHIEFTQNILNESKES